MCHADGCGGTISLNINLRTNCTRCLSRAFACVFSLMQIVELEGRILTANSQQEIGTALIRWILAGRACMHKVQVFIRLQYWLGLMGW